MGYESLTNIFQYIMYGKCGVYGCMHWWMHLCEMTLENSQKLILIHNAELYTVHADE